MRSLLYSGVPNTPAETQVQAGVVAGKDAESACNAIEELEATARLALVLRGLPARTLDAEQISQVVTAFDIEWDA